MGRHQGIEHAAAAVVAVHLLCLHPVVVRLLDRLSVLADVQRLRPWRHRLFLAPNWTRTWPPRARPRNPGVSAWRPPTSRPSSDKDLIVYAAAGGRAVFARTASPAMARAARDGRAAIRCWPTTTGSGRHAGRNPEHRARRHPLGHGRARQRDAPFSDQLKAPEIAGLADHVLSLSGKGRPERRRRQAVRGAMPPVTAPTAVATRVGRAEHSPTESGFTARPRTPSPPRSPIRHGVMPTWEGRLDAVALRWSRPMSMRSVGASRAIRRKLKGERAGIPVRFRSFGLS